MALLNGLKAGKKMVGKRPVKKQSKTKSYGNSLMNLTKVVISVGIGSKVTQDMKATKKPMN